MKIVFFVEQEDIRGRTARDQPVSVAGDSLGREMLERNSQVPRNTLALPHSLAVWGRTRRAVPPCRRAPPGRAGFAGGRFTGCMLHGLINLEELDRAVRSNGRQVHVSFPREVQKLAGTLL